MRIEMTELLPRHAFLAPLLQGARVLELGALERNFGAAAVALRERGAASVLSVGSPAAVEKAKRERGGPNLSFRAGPLAQLPEGAFDLVLVHDAAALFASHAVATSAVPSHAVAVPANAGDALADGGTATLARRLAPGGRLVVAVPGTGPSLLPRGGDGAGYGAVLGALRPHFPSIEVATQQVVLGWVMSPTAGTPQLAIDDALARGEAPAFHLLICGEAPAALGEQLLVPLPAAPVLAAWGERDAGVVLERERARAEKLVGELRAARERIAERESWIEGLRHEVEQRHQTAEEQAAELRAAQVKLVKLEREHGESSESLRRVREQLVARGRELDGARHAVDARTEDLRIVEEELESVRAAARAAQRDRSAAEEKLTAAQARVAALEAALAATQARLEGVEAELGRAQALGESLESELALAREAAQPPGVHGVEQEQQRVLAELEALRATPPDVDAEQERRTEDWPRRVRALEEEVDAAARRQREAEERMRVAEQRADAAEGARAESVATARRWQLEAETARREAAGVAAGMADREALRIERDEAIARAAEEAGRRAAARAQLQAQIDRADEAEAALRRALDQAGLPHRVEGRDRQST